MSFASLILDLRTLIIGFYGLFIIPVQLLSQVDNASFQHLNIENGLSNNTINSIVQDDEGYIWIATNDGLNKFNGYTSKLFYPNKLDSNNIVNTSLGCSFKDSKGRLWFGANGLILCDPVNESFTTYKYIAGNTRSIPSNDVFCIIEDEHLNIWVGTRSGLVRFDEVQHDFTRFYNDTIGNTYEIYSRNRIIDMVSDRSGNLWLATLAGLYQFSLTGKHFTPFLLNPKQTKSRTANQSKYLCIDQCGTIWINYYESGLYRFDVYSKKYTKVIFSDENMNQAALRMNSIICDSKNNIWIASSFNGLIYRDSKLNVWKHYQHDVFNSKSLAENKLISLYEDRSGMIWVGTASKGVDRIPEVRENFMNFMLQPGKLHSLCENDISCFHEDKNHNLWMGSKSGLMFYNRALNTFKCYKHDIKNSNSLTDNCIYSIDIDSMDNLWIATENGLNYFEPDLNRWTRYPYQEENVNGIASRLVLDVRIRKNGEVWLATAELVCRFVPKSGTFENRHNTPAIENLHHAFYATLFEDRQQSMWVSTTKSGFFKLDDQFNLISSYRKSGGFHANTVHQFEEDSSGTLWMASDMGVYYKKSGEETVRKLKSTNAVLNGDIKSIVLDEDGKFWVGTLSGLVHFTLDQNMNILSLRIFTDKDGLQSKAFNTFAGIRLASGELCFGGINGFNIFNPSTIRYNSFLPPIKFASFKLQNRDTPVADFIGNGTSLNLNYDQNDFSFEMTALNYNNPAKNQFGYQLIGYDKKINYNAGNRMGQYSNVPPGNYQLKILGSNNDGMWNAEGAILNLTIHPPYWKTIWFRIFIVLLIGLSGSVLYSQKIKTIQKQEKEKAEVEKKIAEAKSIALRAQMNPHFIFNSMNSIQHLISESAKEDAHKYLSKFSKLMRLVLENSSKTHITIASETEMLKLYLEMESLRFANKFTYHIQIGDDMDLAEAEIPSMLLHPFVENAVIHGLLNKLEPGHLNISINRQSGQLICIIEDNGIGRAAAGEIKKRKVNAHHSLGLQVTEDRIKMMETITNKKAQIKIEDLKNEDGIPAGTRVVIEMPVEFMS
ncbi:MAG: histidine kinase [Saprospiraceae bacterium]|nr:histidine kinase [Saprospiraceae bacterium]